MRCHSASSCAVADAAMTSEWPFRYFVAECITMCAPSAIGCVSIGVADVESTATIAPTSRASVLAAAMSVMSHVGFAGVSIQTRRGAVRVPWRRGRRSPNSRRTRSRVPRAANSSSHLRSAQYMLRGAKTTSPGDNDWNNAPQPLTRAEYRGRGASRPRPAPRADRSWDCRRANRRVRPDTCRRRRAQGRRNVDWRDDVR